jgi:hypothetical protein
MKEVSKLIFILIAGIFSISAFLSGCLIDTGSNTFWVIDSDNHFHTTDIERAQNEVPFSIIFPTYLPDGMDPKSPNLISGPIKALGYHEVEIIIDYVDDDRRVYIYEQNVRLNWQPTEELDPIYLDIAGIKILCQKAQMLSSSGTTEGLGFHWNQDSLTISVSIYSISQEEGIKIIESMVKQ